MQKTCSQVSPDPTHTKVYPGPKSHTDCTIVGRRWTLQKLYSIRTGSNCNSHTDLPGRHRDCPRRAPSDIHLYGRYINIVRKHMDGIQIWTKRVLCQIITISADVHKWHRCRSTSHPKIPGRMKDYNDITWPTIPILLIPVYILLYL